MSIASFSEQELLYDDCVVRKWLPLFIIAAVSLIVLGVLPGWGIYLALPLSAIAATLLIYSSSKSDSAWGWATIGSLLWSVEEVLWSLARLSILPDNLVLSEGVILTDLFYFSGVVAWFVALHKMPHRYWPRRNLLVALPVLGFLFWLLLQNFLTLSFVFPIAETLLFIYTIPIIESAFRGRAHEGRVLWCFGFFVRAFSSAVYAWLASDLQSGQFYFLLSIFGYIFIGLGAWLELRNARGRLLPIAYTVVALEAIIGIVLVMVYQAKGDLPVVLGVTALILAYILFSGVMIHITADRNRRLRAERGLRKYSALLERLVSFHPDPNLTMHPETLLHEFMMTIKTFFPNVTGVVFSLSPSLSIGKLTGYAFPLVTGGMTIGYLYFEKRPDYMRVLDALAPLLAGRLKIVFSQADLRSQALSDSLTGLLNRRGFEEKSSSLLIEAWNSRDLISIVILDIDHFKQVNDQYGHAVGDKILKHLASILKKNTRSKDLLVRWGGEEFVLILYASDLKTAQDIIKRIQTDLREQPMPPIAWPITLSAGLAGGVVLEKDASFTQWIQLADRALLRAKEEGRDRIKLV